MTNITIERKPDGSIRSFKISGHAFFADAGHDIVCAGISAVSVGAVNALEKICNIKTEEHTVVDEVKGFLQYHLPQNLSDVQMQNAQVILEAMIVSLQTIALSYGAHVKVNE
jgi:uncharacterized protein YsxB (DUF464 family)